MEIAKTILSQLGGRKFIAMTGSTNFIAGEYSLSMTLKPNKLKAKFLKITLDPNDTYTMTFYALVKCRLEVKFELPGVYCDMLQDIFTEQTGFNTSL